MSKLNAILDAGQQQLTLDELLAVVEAEENGHICEVEAECRAERGLVKRNKEKHWTCGWVPAGTVGECTRRKRLKMGLKNGAKER